MDESKYFELKPIKIENAIEGCISIFAENEKRITNQNFDSYLESDVRSSFDASFYNEMEIYEQRTERLDSQESGILRKITETHNDVNLNSSKFVPKVSFNEEFYTLILRIFKIKLHKVKILFQHIKHFLNKNILVV